MNDIFKNLCNVIQKNSPVILTTFAITGVIATAVLAVKATPNAMAKIDIAENDKYEETHGEESDISVVDKVKLCWKDYAPAATMGVATISCILGSTYVNAKRQAAISAAYILTEHAFDDYKNRVIKEIGQRKNQKIEDEIAQEAVNNKPPSESTIIITGSGDHLCFDSWTGRYFRSSMEKLRRAENEANHDLLTEMWISLNDVYERIGLDPVEKGDELGWSIDGRDLINFRYSTCMSPDDEPTITINFVVEPKYGGSTIYR